MTAGERLHGEAWSRLLGLGCLVALASMGCANKRTLSWQSGPGAQEAISQAKRVAVLAQTSFVAGGGLPQSPAPQIADKIVAELLASGHVVTMVREATAVIVQAGTERRDFFEAARESKAELLFEFLTQGSMKMETQMGPMIPFVPPKMTMTWRYNIDEITLRVSSVANQSVLCTVSVLYEKSQEKTTEVVKDALLALELIRQGKAASALELTGPPGSADGSKPAKP